MTFRFRIKESAPESLKQLFPTDELLVLVSDDPTQGALATQSQWDSFAMNPAHLFEDGIIKSYNRQVGRWTTKELHDEGVAICGQMDGDMLLVSSIKAYGEGSGTALNWIIEPALQDSTGKLVAVRVWEGGDSIDRLIVDDGDVSSEPIEL